jgi:SPP1 gp7 family putative phage head morphogenesis protein
MKPTGKAAEYADLTGNRTLQALLSRLGTRIKGINETTREKVSAAIREGIEAGDGAAALGDRVQAAAAFDEYRAELIARTESAQVLNEAQIESFREFGVERVTAIDGDDDPECAERNGKEFDIDEALNISDHPNGTLDWSPVIASSGKADMEEQVPTQKAIATMAIPQISVPMTFAPDMSPVAEAIDRMGERVAYLGEEVRTLAERPNPAPVVNVAAAEVNVPVPVVNVEAPVVNLPTQKATFEGPIDMRIVDMPDRVSKSVKEIERDGRGLIKRVSETTVDEDA